MILSIVSGTYNRLVHLQKMVDSARAQIPRHIEYEFVIVDGGSTDGTIAWCKEQQDITLIRHGELRGAIPAFCDGAKAARGEYVLLANDDISFGPHSIMRAVAYLETHPNSGAVAFADTRAEQMGEGTGYQVLGMPAQGADGHRSWVLYAQVGLFRKWLGDRAGWWGADDPIMSRARTYGGDNYLSSRVWEMGYSIDAVEGCQCDDLIVRDELRGVSAKHAQTDSAAYYARYPVGPKLLEKPAIYAPQTRRLRILAAPIYEPGFPARRNLEYGLSEALAKYGLLYEWDYANEPGNLAELVKVWRPDLLFLQMHDAGSIALAELAQARVECPEMVVVNWNGDAHENGLISAAMMELLHYVDLQLVVNAAVLPVYAAAGIKADYWQIGYKDPVGTPPVEIPQWDVLFLGNCYNPERRAMAMALREIPRVRVGIYGNCAHANGNTHYNFTASHALYQKCKIAISDTFPGTVGYVSNRLFQALAAGAFVLQQYSPDLEKWNGLKAGTHYVEWTDLADLDKLIRLWSRDKKAADRERIARAGRDFVRANFSYDRQVEKLWDLLP